MTIQIVKQGKPFLFDSDDWSLLSNYNWHVNPDGYARTTVNGKVIKMHRFLLNVTDSNVPVDHVNRIRTDNRRCNIRVVTWAQNAHNSCGRGETKYKGVTYQVCSYKSIKTGEILKYRYLKAKINVNNKNIHLGTFKTEEEAARAYDKAAKHYFGEYALLNNV